MLTITFQFGAPGKQRRSHVFQKAGVNKYYPEYPDRAKCFYFRRHSSIQPISHKLSSNKPPTIQGMFDVDRWFQISKMLVLLAESDATKSYVPRKSQRPLANPPPEFLGLRTPPRRRHPFVLALRSRFTQKGCLPTPARSNGRHSAGFLACHFADV